MSRYLSLVLVLVLGSLSFAADPNTPGVTSWALVGANPTFGQSEELRLGYDFGGSGLLSFLEPAAGVIHSDNLDLQGPAWAIRGYLLAHALDASLFSRLIGGTLPDGNVYGGLYGQYRTLEGDVTGGWLVGVLVQWPQPWAIVTEYDHDLWGERANTQTVVAGIMRKF